jgi:hypothetical protein
VKKVPALAILQKGSPLVEVDREYAQRPASASSRKSTPAPSSVPISICILRSRGIDTIIMAAAPPAAASAPRRSILQYAYHTIVVREAVGDRAAAKRGEPFRHRRQIRRRRAACGGPRVSRRLAASVDFAAKAQDDFDRWWPRAQRLS